jgi:hypothetical protein
MYYRRWYAVNNLLLNAKSGRKNYQLNYKNILIDNIAMRLSISIIP